MRGEPGPDLTPQFALAILEVLHRLPLSTMVTTAGRWFAAAGDAICALLNDPEALGLALAAAAPGERDRDLEKERMWRARQAVVSPRLESPLAALYGNK